MLALKNDAALFNAWTINAAILAVLGGAGGLLVAFTMKYTNAIIKTFATSGAIIVTAFAGHMLLDAPLDIPIGIGGCCTVLALVNYNDDGSEHDTKPGTKEKSVDLMSVYGWMKNIIGGQTHFGEPDYENDSRALIEDVDIKSDTVNMT